MAGVGAVRTRRELRLRLAWLLRRHLSLRLEQRVTDLVRRRESGRVHALAARQHLREAELAATLAIEEWAVR